MGAEGKGCAGDEESGAGGNGVGSDQCEPICNELASSGCANDPSYDSCTVSCLSLTSTSACRPAADDYFDCANAATVECTADGAAYYPNCGDEWLIAIGCAVTHNPNPAIEEPCSDYCDSFAAAECENSNSKDVCTTNCLWAGATGTGCDDEWLDYITCVGSVDAECLAGYAYGPGCGEDYLAYWACIDAVGN
jgi:hypothetical protein